MRTMPLATMLAAGLVALSACASRTFETTWRDPTYDGRPFGKLLVVGSTDNAGDRRAFEDAVVSDLRSRGVEAVASYTLIPDAADMKRDAVLAAARASGADGLISTRLIGVETKSAQVPVRSRDAADANISRVFPPMESPATVRQDYRIATLETDLFDANTGKMVWWGRGSAPPTADISSVSRDLGATIVEFLKSANLL